MKLFTDYLAESIKSYNYVIKFAEKPTDNQIGVIESWLKKYDLLNISAPAVVENSHRDFIDIPNRNVHMIEVTLGRSVNSYVLLQDLKTAANISEKMMVVRGSDEPVEKLSSFDSWRRGEDAKASADGFEPDAHLSTDRTYLDAEQPAVGPLYGNDYNKKLLSYLAGIEANRPTMHVDPPAPLFTWLKMDKTGCGDPHQDLDDFNAHHDTPKPVGAVSSDITPIEGKFLNTHGGMSDAAIPSVKLYKNKTGDRKQVVRPVEKK